MDKDDLCASLIKWLQTFPVTATMDSPEDLTDGIAMSQALNQIDPDFFTSSWLSKIKADSSSNWRLKVSNLKKILKGILDYYSDVLGQHIQDFQMPDVNAIGENTNLNELGRLLQLILGCAVNCDKKQDYIERIMSLEESLQHAVMNAIQELMTKETPAHGESFSEMGDQLKRTLEELNSVIQDKEEIARKCHELDLQVVVLQEEKAGLVAENDRLHERINQSESLEDPTTTSGRRYQQLQHQVDKLKDEVFRLEAARDDYRMKVDHLEKELLDSKSKNEELVKLAEEARSLKDEVDVLRHSSEQVVKYESSIDAYKKKLEDLSDLKRQMKVLEEKNTMYMQQNMELEEEIRKIGSLKSQVEMYKRQVQDLQGKILEETKRADKADFQIKRSQEQITSLQRERDRLITERDSLKETNEELACSNLPDHVERSSGDVISPNVELMAMPPEIREKYIKLQHENKVLKLNQAGSNDENIELVKSLLDDANARNAELTAETRILNQRIIELEAYTEDLQSKQTSSGDHSEVMKKLHEHMKKQKDSESELQNRDKTIEDLENRLAQANDKAARSQSDLLSKVDEMKHMEERYKKYLEKAKSIIRQLDPKLSQGSAPEIQALKNQLQEKDRMIEHLERDHERTKLIREQEEKLIVSAWYNMGMQLHRKAMEDRLANSGAGQSFLARQRQAQNRRLQNAHSSSNSDFAEY